jgi:Saxitoxin biosynthesis operon protein SxtJ
MNGRRVPTRVELAVLGLSLPIAFTVVGLLVRRHLGLPGVARGLWTAGAILTLLFWTVRALRWPIHEAWMSVTHPLAAAASKLLVAMVFFLVVTPIGLLARLVGRDALARRATARRASYWFPQPGGEGTDPRRYLRQS